MPVLAEDEGMVTATLTQEEVTMAITIRVTTTGTLTRTEKIVAIIT